MEARDMFVLDQAGNVVHTPEPRPPPYKAPKLSECAPLFTAVSRHDKGLPACPPACLNSIGCQEHPASAPLATALLLCSARHQPPLVSSSCCATSADAVTLQAYELRNAGAVLHSHSLSAVMATMLDPQATEFTVTHLEMIKVRSSGSLQSISSR